MDQQPTPTTISISAERVEKGRLLMAGLAEEIRQLWDALSQVDAAPVPGGQLQISADSGFDVLNWLRRALTSIRSLDQEVFRASGEAAYEAIRSSDPRGGAVRGLVGPRNNAVHHPEVVDPGVDHALGPLGDGRYFIFPTWVRRTDDLKAMFTVRGEFSEPYANAYDNHVATRSLHDPLLDAFDFFDSLAPHLARRGADGQLAHFPLTPPPIFRSRDYFRLTPSSPHEQKQRAVLDVQKRFELQMTPPGGRERVIDGAIELADGSLVFTGHTVLDEIHSYSFLEPHDQVESDIRRGFRYLLLMAQPESEDGADLVLVSADLSLANGQSLPTVDLLKVASPNARMLHDRWQLCLEDANEYARFRRPHGA